MRTAGPSNRSQGIDSSGGASSRFLLECPRSRYRIYRMGRIPGLLSFLVTFSLADTPNFLERLQNLSLIKYAHIHSISNKKVTFRKFQQEKSEPKKFKKHEAMFIRPMHGTAGSAALAQATKINGGVARQTHQSWIN